MITTKLFRVLSHPFTVIICFLLILISGQHMGGFYIYYILLALPFGGMHAWLAVAGIGLLMGSYYRYGRRKAFVIETLLNIGGLVLLGSSLIYFFLADKSHYNSGTFNQAVPLVSIGVASATAFCFLVDNLIVRSRNNDGNSAHFSRVGSL